MTDKELQIIQEAKALFITKGITTTSIEDIAKACKISKATFYKYFVSKECVIAAILEYNQNQLENQFKSIDSNYDLESKEKLKQKIILIWTQKYSNYDFSAYVARLFAKNQEEDKINRLQKANRNSIISEYRKSLIMTYEGQVKGILWDLIFIIDGLVYEFISLMRVNKQNFAPEFVGDFILNIIDNMVETLDRQKTFMTREIVYGLEGYDHQVSREEYENYFLQKLHEIKGMIQTNIRMDNTLKLLQAIEEVEKQAKEKQYDSLIIDAMIAFLATEESLRDKVSLLNTIKDRLGEDKNEKGTFKH